MKTKKIEVQGYISDLFADKQYKDIIKNIGNEEEFFMSMIYSPIIFNGNVVGVVTDIDLDEGVWCAICYGNFAVDVDLGRGTISALHPVM